jgi:hypothetical protein
MFTHNQYTQSKITSPLNNNQYPCIVSNLNAGVQNGIRPNPPKFYPANNNSVFSMGRNTYKRTESKQDDKYIPNGKYNAPQDSSSVIARKKQNAIGKSSLKQSLSYNKPLSYKNTNTNNVNNALRRVRNGGSVAPAKKGSIYNNNLSNPRIHSWGTLPKSTY